MWAWFLIPLAMSSDDDARRNWELTQAGLLEEVLSGNLEAAEARYQAISELILPAEETRQLTVADASLPEALYWLGRARWARGDVDGAREALDRCIRAGVEKAPCLDLRSRIDLDVEAVHQVPTSWTFEDANHGVFHPRALWHRGSLRLVNDGDTSQLEWRTHVDGTTPDELVVGFREPEPTPETLRIVIRSLELDGALQIVFEDTEGQIYIPETKPIRLDKGVTRDIVISISEFRSAVPGGPTLEPERLHRLRIRDATGLTGQLGPNVWALDLFEVR
jgi:hypothetical protein